MIFSKLATSQASNFVQLSAVLVILGIESYLQSHEEIFPCKNKT
jgi:hypothetical protein